MFQNIVRILGGDPHKREIKRLSALVEEINALEPAFEKLSDDALRAKTDEFKARLAGGATLDELLVEAYAAVREASKRTIGLRHYDVQLIGGMNLHYGRIAEMRTGEGKTLVATLPVYLNALTGRGVHLITVNDYLARRDARWMAPVYQALGLSVGVLQMAARTENGKNAFLVDLNKKAPHEDQDQLQMVLRRDAYQADITYGTNSEFGFDYLRDNLTYRLEDRVQRGHYFAIVDEVDNILIDEARTPLIISGPASEDTSEYNRMAQVARQLQPEDYEINEKDRTVTLTEVGEVHCEELLGESLRDPERPEDITPQQARLMGYLEQALKAQFLFKRNKDYLVQSGKVIIIDEFTGRLMPGRRWSEGLHQAVEAKEGVKVEPENVTQATITIQNYFRMYEKLSGMTGTALTEAEEFSKIYKLEILPIPTNLEYRAIKSGSDLVEIESKDEQGYKFTFYAEKNDPQKKALFWKRKDYPDVVFRSEEAKIRAITQEIITYHVIGRPQLVGTTSVEHSERLSDRLSAEPIRRLAQVLLIRQAWMDQHNMEAIETVIPELAFLNTPLPNLEPAEMRQMARSLNISLNPEEPANLESLKRILGIEDADLPRLVKILQGGVPHQVLNARKHDEESQIIAGAGAFGAVTIATNMAGRGVDIKLGGELPEELLADVIRVLGKADVADPYDMTNEERREALLKMNPEDYGIYEASVAAFMQYLDDMKRVRELGGLHVIGSERHEARRIDNQLRGRAARQGDPGSSRFYLSLEDDLMRLFGGAQAESIVKRFNIDPSLPIESGLLGRLVEQSQERVEGSNFDIRKHLLEYDDVLNSQRKRIYEQRDRVLTKDDLNEDVLDMLRTELKNRIPEGLKDEEGPWKLMSFLEQIQPTMDFESLVLPSFPLQLVANDLREHLPKNPSLADLRAGLLREVESTLLLEKEHLIRTTQAMLDGAASTLEQVRTERLDLLDTFFDGLDDVEEGAAPRRPQEMLDELVGLVRVPIKLNNEQLRGLPAGDKNVKDAIRTQIENAIKAAGIVRAAAGLERRLGEPVEIKPSALLELEWDEISDRILDATENLFNRRMDRLVGSEGQVGRDLDPVLDRVQEAAFTPSNLIQLLRLMAVGTRTEFDARTHKKGRKTFNRLTYIFQAARLVQDLSTDDVTERVLEHLENTQASLEKFWGRVEFARLAQTEAHLDQLDEHTWTRLGEVLGPDRLTELASEPLINIPAADRDLIADVLGRRLKNETYRTLLLSVITEQWVDYLTKVEALRVSVGLEAYAQRNPLVEYKGKASEMFSQLLSDVRMGVVRNMFLFQPRRSAQVAVERAPGAAPEQAAVISAEPSETPAEEDKEAPGEERKKKRRRH